MRVTVAEQPLDDGKREVFNFFGAMHWLSVAGSGGLTSAGFVGMMMPLKRFTC
jgi:hypothetical protein